MPFFSPPFISLLYLYSTQIKWNKLLQISSQLFLFVKSCSILKGSISTKSIERLHVVLALLGRKVYTCCGYAEMWKLSSIIKLQFWKATVRCQGSYRP